MLFIRKFLFYLFAAIYLVCCPLTVLYALGYAVHPLMPQGLVKTGLIYISTTPPGASIYLGNSRYTKRTPSVLSGLVPGDYWLKINLKNYEPWTRKVVIKPEKAVAFDKILLLPKNPKFEGLLAGPFEDLVPIPGTRFLLVTTGSNLEDFLVYDWKARTSRPLLGSRSRFQAGRVLSYTTVKESPLVLFRIRFQGDEKTIAVDLSREKSVGMDLSFLFPDDLAWVEWDPRNPRRLFGFRRGEVHRLDLSTMTFTPRIAENVLGMGVHERHLYLFTKEHLFQRVDADGKHPEIFFKNPPAIASVFEESNPFFQIKVLAQELILFLGDRGELLLNRFPYLFVEHGTRGFEFDPSHRRLLVWRSDAVGVLDLPAPRETETALEHTPEIRWVYTHGRDIRQAFFVYKGSHALFRDGAAIYRVELEAPGEPAAHRLLTVSPRTSVFYAEDSGRLYYLDRETDELVSMEILPSEWLSLLAVE